MGVPTQESDRSASHRSSWAGRPSFPAGNRVCSELIRMRHGLVRSGRPTCVSRVHSRPNSRPHGSLQRHSPLTPRGSLEAIAEVCRPGSFSHRRWPRLVMRWCSRGVGFWGGGVGGLCCLVVVVVCFWLFILGGGGCWGGGGGWGGFGVGCVWGGGGKGATWGPARPKPSGGLGCWVWCLGMVVWVWGGGGVCGGGGGESVGGGGLLFVILGGGAVGGVGGVVGGWGWGVCVWGGGGGDAVGYCRGVPSIGRLLLSHMDSCFAGKRVDHRDHCHW